MSRQPYTVGGFQPGGAGASPRDTKAAISLPYRLSSESLKILSKQVQENMDSQVMQINRIFTALGQVVDLEQGRITGILDINAKKVTVRGLETVTTILGDSTGYVTIDTPQVITGNKTFSGTNLFTKDAVAANVFEPAAGAGASAADARAGFPNQFHADANSLVGPQGSVYISARTNDADAAGQKTALHVRYSTKATCPANPGFVAANFQTYTGAGLTCDTWAAVLEVRDQDATSVGKKIGLEIGVMNMGEAGGTGDSDLGGTTAKYAIWLRGNPGNVANTTMATAAIATNNTPHNFYYGMFLRRMDHAAIWLEAPEQNTAVALKIVGPSAAEQLSGGAAPGGTWASIMDAPNALPIIRGRNNADNAYVTLLTFNTSDQNVLGSATTPTLLPYTKATTGDPTGAEGLIYTNTSDDVIRMYADSGWRTLAHWPVHRHARTYSFTSRGVGAGIHYVAGYYKAPAADVTLAEDGAQTYGGANVPYAAHAIAIASGAGTGVLTVSGTSITDQGVRTATDSEVIVADASAASTDDYFETNKKWLGTITYTLTGGGADFTFNYGLAKYDDWGNVDFTINDFEVVGEAGANDGAFDIELLHHQATGWTYSAAAFVPGSTPIVQMTTDHSTESDIDNSDFFAYKRDNLTEAILGGTGEEGFIVRITTGENNTVQSMNVIVGIE